MGLCASADTSRSDGIDRQIKRENKRESLKNHILLLGPGESGKSTFMKQLIAAFGKGHCSPEFIPIIHRNIVRNICMLVEASLNWGNDDRKYQMAHQTREKAEDLIDNDDLRCWLNDSRVVVGKFSFTEETAAIVHEVWSDEGIQNCFEKRSELQLLDSSQYFFEKVREISKPDYIPSTKDIVRARVRTTGIAKATVKLDGRDYLFVDVGGQRSERKKWLHLFDGSQIVIFFAALSEFDQFLFEDEDINRMKEALQLFEEICNVRWFVSTPVVLFLNKKDLLLEKLKSVSLSDWMTGYDGDNSFDDVCLYFQKLFEERNRQKSRKIYTHFTCVLDDSVRDLFRSVAGIVLMEGMVQESDNIM